MGMASRFVLFTFTLVVLVLPTLTFTAHAAPAASAALDTRKLPPNLRVPPDLEKHLERLLEVSPTFRQQIELIRRTRRVRINISYGMRRSSLIDAETVVRKHAYGTLIVNATLYIPGNLTELVVHELEHVCEQIEGVELAALAQTRPGEVHEFLGRYETRRARLAGRRAVAELEARPTAAVDARPRSASGGPVSPVADF